MNDPWTPGPWTNLGPTDFQGELIAGDPKPDAEADDGKVWTAVAEVVGPDLDANARLIALAPEMAELLDELVEDDGPERYARVQALLARARGEDV